MGQLPKEPTMDETITITLRQLESALLSWEMEYRQGLCISREEYEAKSAETVATENALQLWEKLRAVCAF